MTEQTKKATRLSRIHALLMQRGTVSVRELAQELDRSPRTIERDMADLESELGVPLIVVYLFGVWLALIVAAALLARRIGSPEDPPDDAATR